MSGSNALELDAIRAAHEALQLDPSFQRRSVWNLDYQRSFIDTVLRDYPCPPIFLEEDTEPGRPTIWNVIDGKQRITALISLV